MWDGSDRRCRFSNIFDHPNLKFESVNLPSPIFAKFCRSIVWNIRNNFTFCPNIKFPQDCKLQILEQIQI
jgi:hypothetical protein